MLGVAVGAAGLALLVLVGPTGASGGVVGSAWWGPPLVLLGGWCPTAIWPKIWLTPSVKPQVRGLRLGHLPHSLAKNTSLLAGFGWAAGTFATTRLAVPPNPFAMVAVQMLVGGMILMTAGIAAGDRLDVAGIDPMAWWAWVYLSVVVTLGAFSAYAYALAALPVSTVATYAYVNPVIAVLLGVLVVGERFSVLQLVGGGVVLFAVVLVIAAERSRNCRGRVATSPP